MNVARNFLLVGTVYLLAGILMGMVMGGTGDMSLASLHAHIGLLGFTLMVLFALIYRQYPEMGRSWLAPAHFWLYQAGVLLLVIMLFLLLTERIGPESMAPLAPLSELAIALAVALFGWNAWRNAT